MFRENLQSRFGQVQLASDGLAQHFQILVEQCKSKVEGAIVPKELVADGFLISDYESAAQIRIEFL